MGQMFRNKAALVNIFYNYDNDIYNWPVCQKLINVVAKLTEGEYFTSNHYKAPEHRVVQGALRLLARFMELMARYLKAPGLNKGGNLDDQEDFDKLGTDFGFGYNESLHTQEYDGNMKTNGNVPSLYGGSTNLGDPNHTSNNNNEERRNSQHSAQDLTNLATLDPEKRGMPMDAMSVSSYGSNVESQPLSTGNSIASGS